MVFSKVVEEVKVEEQVNVHFSSLGGEVCCDLAQRCFNEGGAFAAPLSVLRYFKGATGELRKREAQQEARETRKQSAAYDVTQTLEEKQVYLFIYFIFFSLKKVFHERLTYAVLLEKWYNVSLQEPPTDLKPKYLHGSKEKRHFTFIKR